MIETKHLRKEFGGKVAVEDLSLTIPRGRVTGLLGLNGAGKTTTIKILATLLRPTSGTVTVGGLDPGNTPHTVRRRINLIAGGERMVYARMTGRENLWYFGQLYDIPGKVLKSRIGELLELVGLTAAAGTRVEQYSRGMTQRLSIARGLINDPDYLLLDEPTLGLDAPIARDLRKVVAELAERGKGVLLTSHYLAEVEQLCEHVYVIGDGRHLAEGSPGELMAQTGCHRRVRITVSELTPEVEAAALAFDDRVRIIPLAESGGGAVERRGARSGPGVVERQRAGSVPDSVERQTAGSVPSSVERRGAGSGPAAVEGAGLGGGIAGRVLTDGGAGDVIRTGAVIELSHPGDVAGALTKAVIAAGGEPSGLEIAEPSLEDAILALSDRSMAVVA
ncbi:ABC transporter ATP-binding protein [Nonomuraea roseoviolacea]|uniref:ABC-2 type transport system ATP-binding protein n=1 Tax=Nonomuraea roseoviolacea subsp. carminata TaxID=160689 RepID=A0ABT1JVR1_9ACTN|nr:ABC transporter ATP-binding protein [Nonomuraea roseoviolacea]MCP2345444.1 ABC-2 type transport system ATP-binding protein [Nonomuraea roseoviolacea subsp. carminata]